MTHHLALITGGTSGIGKAMCELLAKKQINLIISGRNAAELQKLQNQLSKEVKVQIIQADLAIIEERKRLVKVIHEEMPDLVINNAGFGLYGEALSYSTQEQVAILEVNGKAVLELTLETARTLASFNKKGVILNVSSAAAFQILPNMAVYAAAKTFVNQISQALDFEFKEKGIRVLTLCPGMVRTEFQNRAGGVMKANQFGVMSAEYVAQQMWKQIEQLQPLTIIDWKYRLLTFLSVLFPKQWIAKAVKKSMEKRLPTRILIKLENEIERNNTP